MTGIFDDFKDYYRKSVYTNVDPKGDVPNLFEAVGTALVSLIKGPKDKPNYEIGKDLGSRVTDAAWRKRLNLDYDKNLLPTFNGDTVRLPKQLEMEIPVDTNLLKKRISANEKLIKKYPNKYGRSVIIDRVLHDDKKNLESLRHTYKTGEPVGMEEFSWNSRQLVNDGEINENIMPPLNVFRHYNVRYDKPTNRMYYSKSYDFDTVEHNWDKFTPGNKFYIRGFINLNEKRK